jgi:superfamily II DNA/RNA helicase
MIKLIVEDYCHRCRGFEPELEHVQYMVDLETIDDILIFCKYKERCKSIAEYLESQKLPGYERR